MDPMKMGAVQGQYGQFNSAQTILSNLNYNQAVTAYQNDTSGSGLSIERPVPDRRGGPLA